MSALRFLALLLLLVAAVALATDATRAYWGEGTVFTPLSKHWSDLAPNAMVSARRSVAGLTDARVWDWGIAPLLKLPAWMSFGALGIALGWIARRRRRVNIYAN